MKPYKIPLRTCKTFSEEMHVFREHLFALADILKLKRINAVHELVNSLSELENFRINPFSRFYSEDRQSGRELAQ